MNENLKKALIVGMMGGFAGLGVLLAILLLPVQSGGGAYIVAKTGIASLNMAMAATLTVIYLKTYRDVRSRFTFSLILVTLALFIQALTSNPLLHGVCGYCISGLGPFIMISDAFTTFALAALLYISRD